jgi:L-2-aminoadipate reductase
VDFHDLVEHLSKSSSGEKSSDRQPPLFHLRFYNTPDAPSSHFLASTDVNTDLTIFVALETAKTSLRSSSPLPALQLLVRYNQLLFSTDRVASIIDQLSQIVIDAADHPEKSVGALTLLTQRQVKVLPDPTTDLHWSQFKGPIHEIFAKNAINHPDRQCIIETASDAKTQDRIFTYRHIHESSNILAHYLLAKGLSRGDVVMVYAHRGVDLVVAVMGILKAGGTFSVIGAISLFQNLF